MSTPAQCSKFTFLVDVILLGLLIGCNLCSDAVERELLSPDPGLKATMFVRDCGATTDFSTIISLHGSSSSFKEQDHFVFVIKGRAKIELLWTGPRQLSVKCPTCQAGDIYKQLDQFKGVEIRYLLAKNGKADQN